MVSITAALQKTCDVPCWRVYPWVSTSERAETWLEVRWFTE